LKSVQLPMVRQPHLTLDICNVNAHV